MRVSFSQAQKNDPIEIGVKIPYSPKGRHLKYCVSILALAYPLLYCVEHFCGLIFVTSPMITMDSYAVNTPESDNKRCSSKGLDVGAALQQ